MTEMSTYSQQVAKEEVTRSLNELNYFKVGQELMSGKTATLESAMQQLVERSGARICGQGTLNKISEFMPWILGLAIVGGGYYAYKKEIKK